MSGRGVKITSGPTHECTSMSEITIYSTQRCLHALHLVPANNLAMWRRPLKVSRGRINTGRDWLVGVDIASLHSLTNSRENGEHDPPRHKACTSLHTFNCNEEALTTRNTSRQSCGATALHNSCTYIGSLCTFSHFAATAYTTHFILYVSCTLQGLRQQPTHPLRTQQARTQI